MREKMIFCKKRLNECWICGSKINLTGEHKIKKSDLRQGNYSYGSLHRLGTGDKFKIRSINSNVLKFNKSICANCNNKATQLADQSYEQFRTQKIISDVYPIDFSDNLELARYFGKHLGCALKYDKLVIPTRLSKFVSSMSAKNPISVTVRPAPILYQYKDGTTDDVHGIGGALISLRSLPFLFPDELQSSFMTDGQQFIVKMQLNVFEALEIRLIYLGKIGKLRNDFDEEDASIRGIR